VERLEIPARVSLFARECYAGVFFYPEGDLWAGRKNIVLISASGILDVQSLVSSGKFEREFGKLEL
jgi:hypothetical protein